MSLTNKTNQKGFTIVELLIVIVVIGILAAITIVAYNGVQNRARTTTAQANAKEVQNKAETYNADAGNGTYPTETELAAATGTAKLSEKVAGLIGTTAPSSTAKDAIQYTKCATSNGAEISYWDYSNSAVSGDVLKAGDTSGC